MTFPDLHSHLYGSLTLDDLYYLHSRNTPRWEIFINSYKKSYNAIPETDTLFIRENSKKNLLSEYYYFLKPGNFRQFQTAFDLVIALSSTEPEEMQEIVRRVSSRTAGYCELRMLFSPMISDGSFSEKVSAICEAMCAENKNRADNSRIRLAMSLSRENNMYWKKYDILKALQSSNESVRSELTGIDFCAEEEGFPPDEKSNFLKSVLDDNAEDSKKALSVLYHVGESFSDKSIESAARWVLQASAMGCHRLGHAVALGIDPNIYSGLRVKEITEERVDHIKFIFDNLQELKIEGYPVKPELLQNELRLLENGGPKEVMVYYDDEEIKKTRIFQDWAMKRIKEKGTVIEVCPTSNIRIANLQKISALPLWRFMENDLKIVLGSDDPGILKTDITLEYALVEDALKRKKYLHYTMKDLVENARQSISEKISGRLD